MEQQLIWIIGGIGALTMAGIFASFWRRGQGFGPVNLRAVGIVMVGTFAALLAVQGGGGLTAGIGLLGAIAGYLFGFTDQRSGSPPVS